MKIMTVWLCFLVLAPGVLADDPKKPEAKTRQVPYRLTNTNHVLLRAKINGKGPYNFILDTGAPALFVSTAVCKKLGVKADKQGWGKFDRFEIEGGVVLEAFKGRVEDPFQLEGMNGLGLAGAELHGIIGYTALAKFRIEFDFTKNKMAWKPLDFEPPAPLGLGGQAAPAGMDAMGSMMKLLGGLLGKKADQEVVLRGFLGISLEEKNGVVTVASVLGGSPAADGGLRVGDQISKFQTYSVTSVAGVHKTAAKLGPDQTAELSIVRSGETKTVQIKAGRGI